MNTNGKSRKSKFIYEADHVHHTIYVDVESMKRAGQIDNPEFTELTKIRKALSGYKLETKEFPKKNKQTYDGLRIPVMQAFIIQYEATPEKAASALRELNKKKAEGLLRGATYGVVKSWFIKEYGDVYNGSALSKKDGKRDALIKELLCKVDPALIDPTAEIEKGVA